METRKFKDLTIRDAFMFAAVMSDSEICRKVLELALRIPISEVHVQTEKTMAYHSEYHGVRLDVYASDANRTRFNVEMQVKLQKFLPKRSRYYHDQIDMDVLLTGEPYENLLYLFVILIHLEMVCTDIRQVLIVRKLEVGWMMEFRRYILIHMERTGRISQKNYCNFWIM